MKRILLVEDEPTTREILAEVLRGEGYTVDTVAGVGAANTCLRSLVYELVVPIGYFQMATVSRLPTRQRRWAAKHLSSVA